MNCFRFGTLKEDELTSLAQQFATVTPFPHVVIPDVVLVPPEQVLPALPALNHPGWHQHADAYEANKMTFNDVALMTEPIASMLRELNSPAFLQFLERVTGITGLLTDPYLQGAGLHLTRPGGLCAPHIDNHINERLNIFRRLNTLIYLNPGWEESFGGSLELYDHKERLAITRTVVPTWGTCVIFRSDGSSIHGFSRPIVANHTRRTIAVYYYTSFDAARFSGAPMTLWSEHDRYWGLTGGGRVARMAQMHLYRSLRFGSKALAYLAHQARPRKSTATVESRAAVRS